jgi:hypothetical protein
MCFAQRSIISPSISSAASRSDEADAERRRELSPSPEVDLSTPEFDDVEDDGMIVPPAPNGSFSARIQRQDSMSGSVLACNHRSASPPLEKDEKEFTQTARGMQRRKFSQDDDSEMKESVIQPSSALLEVEYTVSRQMELDGELFGDHSRSHSAIHSAFASSPALKPLMISTAINKKGFEDLTDSWEMEWDTRSPEKIELDELDGLLDDF